MYKVSTLLLAVLSVYSWNKTCYQLSQEFIIQSFILLSCRSINRAYVFLIMMLVQLEVQVFLITLSFLWCGKSYVTFWQNHFWYLTKPLLIMFRIFSLLMCDRSLCTTNQKIWIWNITWLFINDKIHCHRKLVTFPLRPTTENTVSTCYRQLG
jgi:hypothetical protein